MHRIRSRRCISFPPIVLNSVVEAFIWHDGRKYSVEALYTNLDSTRKCNELVQKALIIFYRNGFHATGMDMLAAETGISKTSMYKHFRTKEDLILAVLRLRDENFRSWLYRRMEEAGESPKAQLIAMFDALDEWFTDPTYRGCMFIKASAEYQEPDDPIYAQAAAHKRLLLSHFQRLAELADASEPAVLARQLLLLKEGAMVVAHIGVANNPAKDAKAVAQGLMAQLSNG